MSIVLLYTDSDYELAKRLYADLRVGGAANWMRHAEVAPGQEMQGQESAQWPGARALLALLSHNSLADGHFLAGLLAAKQHGAQIMPLMIETDLPLPDDLPKVIKLTRRYSEGVKQILAALPTDLLSPNPLGAIPAWQAGNMAYWEGDFEAALAAYKAVPEGEANGAYGRAAAYNALRQHDKAITEADAAIALDPQQARFYRNRSVAYLALGQAEKALADDEQALALEPDSLHSLSSYAMTLVALKRFDEAKTALEKALGAAPQNLLYRYQLGFLENAAGHWEAALDHFGAVLESDPENANALAGRRLALGQLGRHEEALEEINELIKKQPRKYGHYLTRALVNFYLGQYADSMDDSTMAMRLSPREAVLPSYFNRAIAAWRAGETEQAKQDFLEAAALFPDLKTEAGIRQNTESELCSMAGMEVLQALQAEGRA
jgi:tetratricopeptide (TPR) repeat protein